MNDINLRRLEACVLERILPTAEQRSAIEGAADALLNVVRATGEKIRPGLEYMLVGSVAKGTYLSEPDIDVFVIFPSDVPRGVLEMTGLEIGERSVGGIRKYAEHPYIHGRYVGFEVDIVPCYRLDKGERNLSAVDRTPLHTRYVKQHLSAEGRNQVVLLKRFAKGVGCYGADGRVQGFSGYLLELLVLKYGAFDDVLSAAMTWRQGQRLSLGPMGEAKFNSPLVFYDPVDLKRNVASAVSADKMALFCQAAKEYLSVPDMRFFFPEPMATMSEDEMAMAFDARGTGFCVIRMEQPDVIDDNLYPQVRRTQEGISALCLDKGFDVIDSSSFVADGSIFIVVEVASEILSSAYLHQGPPALNENSAQFLARWREEGISKPFLREGRWMVLAEREHPHLADMLKECIGSAAMGSDLRQLPMEIFDMQQALTGNMEKALTAHLDKRLPWER
jgi:tRNA nucleotidyltransferase (CCA-adding enzyme)